MPAASVAIASALRKNHSLGKTFWFTVDIKNITKETYLNAETTPFELYIKLLSEYFSDNINYDADSIGDLPENFKKLSYQF
ncbi:MAG: hypothetical protein HCA26_08580 [Dolichospermum sp. DET66]|nr:hypothetical protein [Dolichospermum sp. DET66]